MSSAAPAVLVGLSHVLDAFKPSRRPWWTFLPDALVRAAMRLPAAPGWLSYGLDNYQSYKDVIDHFSGVGPTHRVNKQPGSRRGLNGRGGSCSRRGCTGGGRGGDSRGQAPGCAGECVRSLQRLRHSPPPPARPPRAPAVAPPQPSVPRAADPRLRLRPRPGPRRRRRRLIAQPAGVRGHRVCCFPDVGRLRAQRRAGRARQGARRRRRERPARRGRGVDRGARARDHLQGAARPRERRLQGEAAGSPRRGACNEMLRATRPRPGADAGHTRERAPTSPAAAAVAARAPARRSPGCWRSGSRRSGPRCAGGVGCAGCRTPLYLSARRQRGAAEPPRKLPA